MAAPLRRDTMKSLYQEHLLGGKFHLEVKYPEADEKSNQADLFNYPTCVFAPEIVLSSDKSKKLDVKPPCLKKNCACSPTVLKYWSRLIATTSGSVALIYRIWQCGNYKKGKGKVTAEDPPEEDDAPTDGPFEDKINSFSTLSEKYIQSLPCSMREKINFVFSKKGGVTLEFMRSIIHRSILTTGLEPGRAECAKLIAARYNSLLRVFAEMNETMRKRDPQAVLPTPISLEKYMELNSIPDHHDLTRIWLDWTRPYSTLAQLLMQTTEVKSSIQFDGTKKFVKRLLFRVGSDQVQPSQIKVLLVALNEIGQILHWKFVRSENADEVYQFLKEIMDVNKLPHHESQSQIVQPTIAESPSTATQETASTNVYLDNTGETVVYMSLQVDGVSSDKIGDETDGPNDADLTEEEEQSWLEQDEEFDQEAMSLRDELLSDVVTFPELDDSQDIMIICDNVNAFRKTVSKLGSRFRLLQDPMHLMMRGTSKLHQSARASFAKAFSQAMYVGNTGELRDRESMYYAVRDVLKNIPESSMSVSLAKWEGSMLNTLAQIRRGDCVCIGSNIYIEYGLQRKKVSSSATEGVNSEIGRALSRNVSAEVGIRVLEILTCKINLRQGAKFNRNPSVENFDLVDLISTALQINRLIPDSPQTAFVLDLLSRISPDTLYSRRLRSQVSDGPVIDNWRGVFSLPRIQQSMVEEAATRPTHQNSVNAWLSRQPQRRTIQTQTLFQRLHLDPSQIIQQVDFGKDEKTLLYRIVSELREIGDNWTSTVPTWTSNNIVITILYYDFCQTNSNSSFQLRVKSYESIQQFLVDHPVPASFSLPDGRVLLPQKPKVPPDNSKLEPFEEAFVVSLYDAMISCGFKGQPNTFYSSWDFATKFCDGIFSRHQKILEKKYATIRDKRTRQTKDRRNQDEVDQLLQSSIPFNHSPILPLVEPTIASSRTSTLALSATSHSVSEASFPSISNTSSIQLDPISVAIPVDPIAKEVPLSINSGTKRKADKSSCAPCKAKKTKCDGTKNIVKIIQ